MSNNAARLLAFVLAPLSAGAISALFMIGRTWTQVGEVASYKDASGLTLVVFLAGTSIAAVFVSVIGSIAIWRIRRTGQSQRVATAVKIGALSGTLPFLLLALYVISAEPQILSSTDGVLSVISIPLLALLASVTAAYVFWYYAVRRTVSGRRAPN